jgi:DUF971 family protein
MLSASSATKRLRVAASLAVSRAGTKVVLTTAKLPFSIGSIQPGGNFAVATGHASTTNAGLRATISTLSMDCSNAE